MSNNDVNCTFDSVEMHEAFNHMDNMISSVVVDHKLPELASKTLRLAFKNTQLAFEKCDLARKKAESKSNANEFELKQLKSIMKNQKSGNFKSGSDIRIKNLSLAERNKIEQFLESMFPNSNERNTKVFPD